MLHHAGSCFDQCFRFVLFLALVCGVAGSTAAQPPCDFNDDGLCELSDIDMLTIEVIERRDQPPSSPEFDLSRDGVMDLQDRDEWLSLAANENGYGEAYLLGDGDLSGFVDAADLMRLGISWQRIYEPDRVLGWEWGWDFNMDGVTNAADLNKMALNWQKGIGGEAVPEPMSYMLLLLSAAILWRALGRR